jgi:hypothetical protein
MFRIEMLPAAHGDCLWIEYGTGSRAHRILIDGGPAHTYSALRERILHLPADARRFDLLIVTHIDADHVEGVVRLLQDAKALHCSFDRIWFNGRDQLNKVPDPAGEPLGALQGEYLGILIGDYEQASGDRIWNTDFQHGVAGIDRKSGPLPTVDLDGDCRLTLLSPDFDRLLDLKDNWRDELRKARVQSGDERNLREKLEESRQLKPLGDVLGVEDETAGATFELPDEDDHDLAAGPGDALGGDEEELGGDAPFGSDASKANGSSIAVLLEYPKQDPKVRFLLAGDAWPSVLAASIDTLLPRPDAALALTGFKLAHHGSVGNLTESLLARIRCKHYLVSTSGALFRHPHSRAIELLLGAHHASGKARLHFNYLTKATRAWSDLADQARRRYEAFHPKGISLEL